MIDLTELLLASHSRGPREIGHYRASDLYAITHGYLTPEKFLKPDPIDFLGAFRMWQGTWRHKQVQELLEKYGEEKYEIEPERTISLGEGVTLRGHADALSGSQEVIEIKTSDKVRGQATAGHLYQARVYCSLFDRRVGIVVQPVFVEKDGNPVKVYLKEIGRVEKNEVWFQQQLEKLRAFHTAVTKLASLKE